MVKDFHFYAEDQWLAWVDQLSENDYLIIDNFISGEVFREARRFFLTALEEDRFSKAGVGPSTDHKIISSIRGDHIFWLDKERDRELDPFFQLLDETIFVLNRYCYLSLSGFEFHLAHYPAGSLYKKHLDQFKSRNNRMISMIIYLNEGWKQEHGGELKIFKPEGDVLVEPRGGRAVIFKSATVAHEVLKTTVDRYSLTGWLLYLPSGVGTVLG